jgi:hypothetical protein
VEKPRKYDRIRGKGMEEEYLLEEASDFEQFSYNLGRLVAFNSLGEAMGFPKQEYLSGETFLVTERPESIYEQLEGTPFANMHEIIEPILTTQYVRRDSVYRCINTIKNSDRRREVRVILDNLWPKEKFEDVFPRVNILLFLATNYTYFWER